MLKQRAQNHTCRANYCILNYDTINSKQFCGVVFELPRWKLIPMTFLASFLPHNLPAVASGEIHIVWCRITRMKNLTTINWVKLTRVINCSPPNSFKKHKVFWGNAFECYGKNKCWAWQPSPVWGAILVPFYLVVFGSSGNPPTLGTFTI